MKVQDVQAIHNVQIIWHAKVVNVRIHVTIENVPQIQIVHRPIIVPFVVVKEATAAIHQLNVNGIKCALIMLIVQQIFRVVKENVSMHAQLNAKIAANAKSLAMFLIAEIEFQKRIFTIK